MFFRFSLKSHRHGGFGGVGECDFDEALVLSAYWVGYMHDERVEVNDLRRGHLREVFRGQKWFHCCRDGVCGVSHQGDCFQARVA